MKDIGKAVAGLGLFALGLVVLGLVVRGWCLTILWGWFIVPLGVPSVSMAHVIGIGMVGHILLGIQNDAKNKDMGPWEAMTLACLVPLLVTLFGWLVHLWMCGG